MQNSALCSPPWWLIDVPQCSVSRNIQDLGRVFQRPPLCQGARVFVLSDETVRQMREICLLRFYLLESIAGRFNIVVAKRALPPVGLEGGGEKYIYIYIYIFFFYCSNYFVSIAVSHHERRAVAIYLYRG